MKIMSAMAVSGSALGLSDGAIVQLALLQRASFAGQHNHQEPPTVARVPVQIGTRTFLCSERELYG